MGSGAAVVAAYLDASAAVKLLCVEPETDALECFLEDWPLRVSSELLRVELACVCYRQRLPASNADELLAGFRLLPITAPVLLAACEPFTPPQRALDAVHLASAELTRERLGCLITYDNNQAQAAAARGWRTEQPS